MNASHIRPPAVAGQFYPLTAGSIRKQISGLLLKPAAKKIPLVKGCVVPHAGYIYSGSVAARTIQQLEIPRHVILLGPNHTGQGAPFSVAATGIWQTPLGEVRIDSHLAESLLTACPSMQADDQAHAYEHSLEVILPMLQYFSQDFKIVPIAFLSREWSSLKSIGTNIAHTIKKQGLASSTILIASTDMTHYESKKAAQEKDAFAIQAMLALDEDALIEEVSRRRISMCGVAPVVVLLSAIKELGATQAHLVQYHTSAEASGDASSVVGYAGIAIS